MNNPQQQNPLNQYTMLSVIGKGSYAKVILVKSKASGKLFALKSMKKKYIEKKKQQKRVMLEKDILCEINHPFIVKFISSFQNETKLFLVLQYCPGGELFGLLSKRKRLTEDQARFYIAQILLALEYLHSKNIIYRDLKPQNVLIDERGYIKLTDFGLSKNNVIGEKETHSVCGTPEYLPPEVINKQGHGKAVDLWCLGALLYELLHGLPAFYCNNRNQLFNRIKTQNPYLPHSWSKSVKNLLVILFEKDPSIRMSASKNLKSHHWFSPIDWDMLLKKQCNPPFIPKIQNSEDVQNFERQFTQCQIISPTGSNSSFEGKKLEGFSFSDSPTNKGQKMQEQLPRIDQFQMDIQKY